MDRARDFGAQSKKISKFQLQRMFADVDTDDGGTLDKEEVGRIVALYYRSSTLCQIH